MAIPQRVNIAPGDNNIGNLTIDGSLVIKGSVDIELGGKHLGNDHLAVSGILFLPGSSAFDNNTLNVMWRDGFVRPKAVDSFEIIRADGGIYYKFKRVNLPALEGVNWEVEYTDTKVILRVY